MTRTRSPARRIARGLAPGLLLGGILSVPSACSNSVNVLYHTDAGAPPLEIPTCPAQPGAPISALPTPTPAQAAFQRAELTAFMHFGLNTFDGTEYGDATKDIPAIFLPDSLDANQWVQALKAAGFQQAMLVVKHATGFCLWPSAYTDYSVKQSPWRGGRGDVVQEFTDAARAAGLRMGFFFSPWDEHYPSSDPTYETYFINQITELLTNYGPIHEIAWDGHKAPTTLDWKGIVRLAKQLQPNVLVWMGAEIATTGADLRFLGNQNAQATRTTSAIGDIPNGGPTSAWYPADAPVSTHRPNWFWHPNATLLPLKTLQSMYLTTVGMNTTLSLNVPPATTGLVDTADLTLLQQFGAWYGDLYKVDLLRGQPATVDSTWATTGFEAAKALDDNPCTYWAAGPGTRSARLEVTPASSITLKLISLREPIELGERTTKYHVEFKQNGTWNKAPTDASGVVIEGTVIGQRQLWQLTPATVDAIALVIDTARDVPAIAEFAAY